MLQKDPLAWFNQPLYSQPIKAVLVGLIALLCLLPIKQLQDSIAKQLQQEQFTVDQFKQTWGKRQQLIGPLLVIPYTDHLTSVDTLTEGGGESKVLR